MSRTTIAHTCSNANCGKTFKRRVRATDKGGRFVSCPHCGSWQNGPKVALEKAEQLEQQRKRRRERSAAKPAPKTEAPAEQEPAPSSSAEPKPTKIVKRVEKQEQEARGEQEPEEKHAGLFW